MLADIDGELHAERVSLRLIAESAGTPAYVYSCAAFEKRYREFETALAGTDHMICYAIKANSNQAVLKLLAGLGAGFDAVSGGEIARALAAGAPGGRIVFSGVGKSRGEMRSALEAGIRQFNIESEPELVSLNETALSMGLVAPVAVRVNPDIDAGTHSKISTGKADNKFGVPISRVRAVCRQAAGLPGLRVVGLDMHIGSQLTELKPYAIAFRTARELVLDLRADGHDMRRLNLGGGLGISYGDETGPLPTPAEYCAVIRNCAADLGCEIQIEPGRYIAGHSGVLLTEVIHVKEGKDRAFVVVDAAMNDLLRPAMYGASHEIACAAVPPPGCPWRPYDIVGPVCESSDTFAVQRKMPVLSQGDLLVFKAAGAYGAVMASEYNTRPLVPEILVRESDFAIIRKRPEIHEIISRDQPPSWL